MKENILTGVLAALLAAAAAYLQELIVPVAVLLCVMLVDYITGMTRAWCTKTLSSRVGVKGIVKKLAYMFAVAVAIVIDWIIQQAGERIGMELQGFYYVGLLVTIWLILNELISILENLTEIGVPVPGFLVALTKRLKTVSESKGDEAAAAIPAEVEETVSDSDTAEPAPDPTIPGEDEL